MNISLFSSLVLATLFLFASASPSLSDVLSHLASSNVMANTSAPLVSVELFDSSNCSPKSLVGRLFTRQGCSVRCRPDGKVDLSYCASETECGGICQQLYTVEQGGCHGNLYHLYQGAHVRVTCNAQFSEEVKDHHLPIVTVTEFEGTTCNDKKVITSVTRREGCHPNLIDPFYRFPHVDARCLDHGKRVTHQHCSDNKGSCGVCGGEPKKYDSDVCVKDGYRPERSFRASCRV